LTDEITTLPRGISKLEVWGVDDFCSVTNTPAIKPMPITTRVTTAMTMSRVDISGKKELNIEIYISNAVQP
jgi:hypothetical protein